MILDPHLMSDQENQNDDTDDPGRVVLHLTHLVVSYDLLTLWGIDRIAGDGLPQRGDTGPDTLRCGIPEGVTDLSKQIVEPRHIISSSPGGEAARCLVVRVTGRARRVASEVPTGTSRPGGCRGDRLDTRRMPEATTGHLSRVPTGPTCRERSPQRTNPRATFPGSNRPCCRFAAYDAPAPARWPIRNGLDGWTRP